MAEHDDDWDADDAAAGAGGWTGHGDDAGPNVWSGDGGQGPAQTSKLAIWSLVLSIPPLCLPQLAALPMAIVALVRINEMPQRLRGQGLAIAALVVCGLQVLVVPFCFAIGAAVALPGMLRSRIGTNESSTIGSLRSLITAQAQFQSQALVDQDEDGIGEYGTLGELSGIDDCRSSGQNVRQSPFIAAILGVKQGGVSQKSGYHYVLYLPTADGPATHEGDGPLAPQPGDADNQEQRWCAYAWPTNPGAGNRAFFVTQAGKVYATAGTVRHYLGPLDAPPVEAGFAIGPPGTTNLEGVPGLAAAGVPSHDGNTWVPVG